MTDEELLLELAVSPDDEALREAWVDVLLERGDPRGEHARLVRSGDERAARAWLETREQVFVPPALRPFVVPGSVRASDGLLAGCALEAMTGADADRLALEPVWAFVTSLSNAPLAIIRQTRRLERWVATEDALAEVLGWELPMPHLRSLELELARPDALVSCLTHEAAARVFPALRHLEVTLRDGRDPRAFIPDEALAACCEDCARPQPPVMDDGAHPMGWAPLFETTLGQRLESLTLRAGFVDLSAFVPALESTRCDVPRVLLGARGLEGARWSLVLRRTAPGRYRSVDVLDAGATALDREDVETVVSTAPAIVERLRAARRTSGS